MTDKQARFCEEYMVDLNATQAAIRAGYSEDSAYEIGWENLRKHEIQNKIQQLRAEQSERTGLTADWIEERLMAIADFRLEDILTVEDGGETTYKPIDEWPERARIAVSTYINNRSFEEQSNGDRLIIHDRCNIRQESKIKALELLGKRLGIWIDKHKIDQPQDVTIEYIVPPDWSPPET